MPWNGWQEADLQTANAPPVAVNDSYGTNEDTALTVAAPGVGAFEEALHETHTLAMVLSLFVASLGILAAFATYSWKRINADALAARFKPVHTFLVNKWYFDELYDAAVVGTTIAFTKAIRWFDDTVIDGFVNGTASWTRAISSERRGTGPRARLLRLPTSWSLAPFA